MTARILPFLLLLLLVSCEGELTAQTYTDLLAARLEAASRGENPDAVLRDAGVGKEEYERFELDVFSDPDLASRVLENLRRDHPELLPPGEGALPADEK
ncbi:MAG TPA: hypothetical protein VM054_10955 [bacterium]|nr:hypothetical protein [bacterium]